MVDVIDLGGPKPWVKAMMGDLSSSVTIEAGIFLKESSGTSGYVVPFTSSTDLCVGVSAEHAYTSDDTNTLATSDTLVRVIKTTFVGYMRAEAGTYNNGDLLYASNTGTLTKTQGGPVRAVFLGEDGTVVTSGGYLGPVEVKLPNKRTSTSDVGWGDTDY